MLILFYFHILPLHTSWSTEGVDVNLKVACFQGWFIILSAASSLFIQIKIQIEQPWCIYSNTSINIPLVRPLPHTQTHTLSLISIQLPSPWQRRQSCKNTEHRNNNNITKYRVPVAKKRQQEHTQQRGRGCYSLQIETPQSRNQTDCKVLQHLLTLNDTRRKHDKWKE